MQIWVFLINTVGLLHLQVPHSQPNTDRKHGIPGMETLWTRGSTFPICGSAEPTVGLEHAWILVFKGILKPILPNDIKGHNCIWHYVSSVEIISFSRKAYNEERENYIH